MKLIFFTSFFLSIILHGLSQDKIKTDSLISALSNAKADTTKVNIYNELSWNYINYDFNESLMYAQEALNLAQEIDHKSGIALAYTHLSYAYHRKGNFDEALSNINKAIGIYEVLGEEKKVAKSMLTISQIYLAQAKYIDALEYSNKALEYKKEIGDSTSLELNFLTIGVIYQHQGNYSLALENLYKSIEYCKKNNNQITLASNYNNIAVIYRNQNKYDQALEYYQKAVDLHKINRNKLGESQALNNIAVVYEALKLYDQAIQFYYKALSIFKEIGYTQGECTAMTNIAGIEIAMKRNFSEVFKLLTKAQEIGEYLNDDLKLIAIYGLWGQYYLEKKNFSKAMDNSIKAFEISKKINALQQYSDLALQISTICENRLDYIKALDYYKIYHLSYDSLFNIQKTEIIEKMNADFQLNEKQKKLELQENEIKLLERNKKIYRYRSYAILLSSLLLLVFIVFILIYHRKKIAYQSYLLQKEKDITESEKKVLELKVKNQEIKQQSLEDEINYKNKEIRNFAFHIIDKNEFINNLKHKLKNAVKQNEYLESNQVISTILSDIGSKMLLERDREEFLTHVDQINDNFYLNLKKKFPDLSETEIRIASLLRMDFSSKDIAAILHISSKSVDTERYRIRKKINIDADIKLSDYFNKI